MVDASQGWRPRPWPHTYLAMEHDLEIRPVINKIDLPAANPALAKEEVENVIGLEAAQAPEISAKMGVNIQAVLEDIVHHVPAPQGDPKAPFKALIFDSQYDAYRGVVVYFRVMEGTLTLGQTVKMMASGAQYGLVEIGHLLPTKLEPCQSLSAGEVGYLTASIKNVKDTQVGGHHHHRGPPPPPSPSPATAPPGAWCTAASTPRTAPSTPTCGTGWRSSSSTTPPSPSSRRPPPPWASASGAVFWGCSTWRSSRSAWSGSLT